MNLIVCLDDRNGMTFCGKRQSRDRVVCEKITTLVADKVLWLNSYSAKLLDANNHKICVSEDFLKISGVGEYCFVEDEDITPYIDRIEEITLFRWNRHYPADNFFPISLLDGMKKVMIEEFTGNSHEKITMELYAR